MNKQIAFSFAVMAVLFSLTANVGAWGVVTSPVVPLIITEPKFDVTVQNMVNECGDTKCDIQVEIHIITPFDAIKVVTIPKDTNTKVSMDLIDPPQNTAFPVTYAVKKISSVSGSSMITMGNAIQKTVQLKYVPNNVPSEIPPSYVTYPYVAPTPVVLPSPSVWEKIIEETPTPTIVVTETITETPTVEPTPEETVVINEEKPVEQNSMIFVAIGLIVFFALASLGYLKVYRGYFVIFAFAILFMAAPSTVSAQETHNVTLEINEIPNATFIPPTPANGTTVNDSFIANVSLGEQPNSCILTIDNSNYTMSLGSTFCYRTHTPSTGTYSYFVTVEDLNGARNQSATIWVTVTSSIAPPAPPNPYKAALLFPLLAILIAAGLLIYISDELFKSETFSKDTIKKFICLLVLCSAVASMVAVLLLP
jgi:hypothetical protein